MWIRDENPCLHLLSECERMFQAVPDTPRSMKEAIQKHSYLSECSGLPLGKPSALFQQQLPGSLSPRKAEGASVVPFGALVLITNKVIKLLPVCLPEALCRSPESV